MVIVGGAASIVIGGLLALGSQVTAGDDDDGDDVPVAETVEADGQAYAPDTFSIVEGEYVRFVNNDDVTHTFTADDGLFDSGPVEPGDDFRYAFDGPITITYHCEIHPSMTGSVTVTAS